MTEGKLMLALKLLLAAAMVWLQAFSLAHAIEHDHHSSSHDQFNHLSHHHHVDGACTGDDDEHGSEEIECDCLLLAAQSVAILPKHDEIESARP